MQQFEDVILLIQHFMCLKISSYKTRKKKKKSHLRFRFWCMNISLNLFLKALVSLAEEIAKSDIPAGTRKINGKYIQSHLLSRLQGTNTCFIVPPIYVSFIQISKMTPTPKKGKKDS